MNRKKSTDNKDIISNERKFIEEEILPTINVHREQRQWIMKYFGK